MTEVIFMPQLGVTVAEGARQVAELDLAATREERPAEPDPSAQRRGADEDDDDRRPHP